MATYTLGEIATRLGGVVRGDAGRVISGIKPLDQAGPGDLSFVSHPRYRRAAESSRAGGLLVRPADDLPGRDLIRIADPYAALAAVMPLFFPPQRYTPGVSDKAVIGAGTTLGEAVSVGPYAVVGERCVIGARAVLLPGVIIGDDATIGADSVLHPGVVLYAGTIIGERVLVHAGAVIGSDGFGFAETGGLRAKIPQVGNVVIEDEVEIGAGTTIDRATFGSTVIGRGTKIDNLVQIAHNVEIGEGSVLVAQSGIAGSTHLGRGVIVAGQSGAAGHLTLGDGAVVGAKSAVLQDLPPRAFVIGHPAVDHRVWKRSRAVERRLPELIRRVSRIESSIADGRDAGGAAAPRPVRRAGPTRTRRKRSG